MDKLPLVSLVTPSYNQGEFLEATIRSVLEQDYPHIEYIVIDGGSNDNSLQIIRRYASQLAFWVSEPDQGQAQAINKGLRRARGMFVGWLNSDDLLAPGAVSAAVAEFERCPEVGVVYGRLERIDASGRVVPTPVLPKDRLEFSRQFVVGECTVNQPGSFWRRELLDRFGLLDESLHYALDFEYWIRLALGEVVFRRLAETMAYFRLSPTSKTVGHTAAMSVEQMQVLNRLLAAPDLPARLGLPVTAVKRQARRARSRIALHAVYGYWKLGQAREALRWLAVALKNDPMSLFERRWFSLGVASLRRKLSGNDDRS